MSVTTQAPDTALRALEAFTLGQRVRVHTTPPWPTPTLDFGPKDGEGLCHSLLTSHPDWTITLGAEAPEAVKAGRQMPRAAQPRPGIISPADRILSGLSGLGYRIIRRHDGWRARCPYHSGKTETSLAIREFPDGSASVHCFSGCSTADILAMIP